MDIYRITGQLRIGSKIYRGWRFLMSFAERNSLWKSTELKEVNCDESDFCIY